MNLQEAKAQADKIGGVVDWWWTYSVYTAPEWQAFNGTHGYGIYVSKGAEKFFQAEYKKERLARAKSLTKFKKELKLRNMLVIAALVRVGSVYLILCTTKLFG